MDWYVMKESQILWLYFLVSIDNAATPVVALLSGFLQHRLGPKVTTKLNAFWCYLNPTH